MWFVAYRDTQPPRRLGKVRVAGQVTPPLQTLLDWYNNHAWRERAGAYDAHLDQIKQEEREELLRREAQEGAAAELEIVRLQREIAARELGKMNETSEKSEAEILKPRETIAMTESAIKQGRLARGESTENVKQVDLSGMDVAALRKWWEANNASGNRSGT